MIATSVSQRTQEFGVRMALGTSRGGIRRMVARQGLRLVVLGVLAGVFAGLGPAFRATAVDPLIALRTE